MFETGQTANCKISYYGNVSLVRYMALKYTEGVELYWIISENAKAFVLGLTFCIVGFQYVWCKPGSGLTEQHQHILTHIYTGQSFCYILKNRYTGQSFLLHFKK